MRLEASTRGPAPAAIRSACQRAIASGVISISFSVPEVRRDVLVVERGVALRRRSAPASPRASAPTSPPRTSSSVSCEPTSSPISPSRRRRRSSSSNAARRPCASNVRDRAREPRPPSRQRTRHTTDPSGRSIRCTLTARPPRQRAQRVAEHARIARLRAAPAPATRRGGSIRLSTGPRCRAIHALDVLAAQPRPLTDVAGDLQRAGPDRAPHRLRMHARDPRRLCRRQQRRLARRPPLRQPLRDQIGEPIDRPRPELVERLGVERHRRQRADLLVGRRPDASCRITRARAARSQSHTAWTSLHRKRTGRICPGSRRPGIRPSR